MIAATGVGVNQKCLKWDDTRCTSMKPIPPEGLRFSASPFFLGSKIPYLRSGESASLILLRGCAFQPALFSWAVRFSFCGAENQLC